jgi:hypothetical protein
MVSTLTADGMRIEKVTGLSLETVESEEESSGFYDEIWSTNKPTTRYFYDGQMCAEDDQRIQMGSEWDPDVIVTRYGIGARGIDFIGYTEAEQPEVVSFPIYDGHGRHRQARWNRVYVWRPASVRRMGKYPAADA